MITKLEQNLIKSMINQMSDSPLMCVSADHTSMKIDKNTNLLLEHYLNHYKQKTGNTKIGKSAYLHILLKQFAHDQRALLRYDGVDPALFDRSVLTAIQEFKKICKSYVDPCISTQSHAVISILLYSSVRAYEVENGFKIYDYLDDEFFDDEDEARGLPVRPQNVTQPAPASVPLSTIDKDLSDLFEDPEPPKNQIAPIDWMRRQK